MSEALQPAGRVRRSKGKGLRTRTGCVTCRLRHVKCDETRPICRACQRGNRPCQFADGRPRSGNPNSDGLVDLTRSSDELDTLTGEPIESLTRPIPGRSSYQRHDERHDQQDDQQDDQQYDQQQVHDDEQPKARECEHEHQQQCDHEHEQRVEDKSPIHHATTSTIINDNREVSSNVNFNLPSLDHAVFTITSPESTTSGSIPYSADIAPLRWLNLLRRDATDASTLSGLEYTSLEYGSAQNESQTACEVGSGMEPDLIGMPQGPDQHINEHRSSGTAALYDRDESPSLSLSKSRLLRHFIENVSVWIDLTDRDCSFATGVPTMALKNKGLMMAILSLSSRHLSLLSKTEEAGRPSRATAAQYYNETLQYLQIAMGSNEYLKSDELLATVLLISTYEMIDGFGGGWERHLKGVFWIQRSQLIHGESGGLKQAIWWAWLRQDIWAAFRGRRVILSYYTLQKKCAELDRWELTNRVIWLLGQCINFGSEAEIEAGRTDVQRRIERAEFLTASLDEWWFYFAPYRKELPSEYAGDNMFRTVWINPPSCSSAVQIYYFARIMLVVHQPAVSGLKELERLHQTSTDAIDQIGGIACTTTNTAAIVISTQCLYAAGLNTRDSLRRAQIVELLRSHQACTGWPIHDLAKDLQADWNSERSPLSIPT